MKHFSSIVCSLALIQLVTSSPARAQSTPASSQQLAAITERGKALAAYDRAAWHATDAAQAIAGGDATGVRFYIARRTSAGWTVDFGKLDPTGTAFLTAIEAAGDDNGHFTAQRLAPPRSDAGYLPAAARAIGTAEGEFKPVKGFKYNVAVIPNADDTFYVYLYPAQTEPHVFPVGGDERYTISSDGLKALDAHRMHNSILATPEGAGLPSGARQAAGFRTVVVENVPQDTDVFHVLARTPSIPDYIDAQGQMYVIATDGTIKYVGPAGAKSQP